MTSGMDFEIVDRRRVGAEADVEAPAPEPPVQTAPVEEHGALPALTADGLIRSCLGLLSDGAWVWLGLVPDPMTGEVKRDLRQARMAIDAVRALAGTAERHLSEDDRRELQTLLANLQMNFVNQNAAESKGE